MNGGGIEFSAEVEGLIRDVNSFEMVNVSCLDQLTSGIVVSHIIEGSQPRPAFSKLIKGCSEESVIERWKLIVDYMKLNYIWTCDYFLPDEIMNDRGVLLLVIKSIIALVKIHRKCSHRRVYSQHSSVSKIHSRMPSNSNTEINGFFTEQEKFAIFGWLQEIRLITPGVSMKEFLSRVRYGVSLFEMLKKLDFEAKKIEGVCLRPVSLGDCIRNLNLILRFLRTFTKIDKKSLYVSDGLFEGNPEVVFEILVKVQQFYRHREMNEVEGKKDPESALVTKKKEKSKKVSFDKYAVIDWISAIGLLDKLIASDNPLKNTLENGVLLCEVLIKVYAFRLKFEKSPKTTEDCSKNFSQALKFLNSKLSLPPITSFKANENLSFEILHLIMNSTKQRQGIVDPSLFQHTESSLLAWLKSGELIPNSTLSIFSIIPEVQSGSLLLSIVNCLSDPTEILKASSDPIQTITESLKALQLKPLLNQRFTSNIFEIYKGDVFIIISLLEDLKEYFKKINRKLFLVGKKNGKSKSQLETDQIREIEQWLGLKGIRVKGIDEEEVKDFKTGEKLCVIVEKIFLCKIDKISEPKTCAEALCNIKKGLGFLYSSCNLPNKYKYMDDLILAGDGGTIRDLLLDIKRII